VDGIARVEDAVAAAAADGMPALAVTDAGNLFGAIKFYEGQLDDARHTMTV